jgi:hypothetical protein
MKEYYDSTILDCMEAEVSKHKTIIQGVIAGRTLRAIGRDLGVFPSTIAYYKRLHFPTAPQKTHETRAEIRKRSMERQEKRLQDKVKRKALREARDQKILDLLQSKTFREVSEELGVSLGLVSKVSNVYTKSIN